MSRATRKDEGGIAPPFGLLERRTQTIRSLSGVDVQAAARKIEDTLATGDVMGVVIGCELGPVFTKYEIALAHGVRENRVADLADGLAGALKASNVRVLPPTPGKNAAGLEVANPCTELVGLRDLMERESSSAKRKPLPLFLGKDAVGAPIVQHLGDLPHLLIAGTVGSGKSVCLNSIILSLLYSHTPQELKLFLIDPTMIEFEMYRGLPHLLAPVVTEVKRAMAALGWLVREIDERREAFGEVGVKSIDAFNALGKGRTKGRTRVPRIVVVCDELADLMRAFGADVERLITSIAWGGSAIGIHLVLATQRPKVDVVTGLIKANMPARISFCVPSKVASRIILDCNGAESLLGRGDMLVQLPNSFRLIRAQGAYVSEKEVRAVVKWWKRRAKPEYRECFATHDNRRQ